MKALLVDDDFNYCKILLEFLVPYGKHDMARNGYEAIEKFLSSLEINQPYDLICLDVMMNDLDGLKTLNIIRRIEKIKKVEPIKLIFVTALDEDEINGLGHKTETTCYLQKPVQKATLLNTIKKLGISL